ncbi:MAG: hypothetical protein OQJ81_06125, partial [Melioribacteraceae bacterium]|nr:hypothetical protein [Melioribacteraceae bacterium]
YRQITESRDESEPIFSIGIITYPMDDNFYIGGTFQYLNSKDKFYAPSFGFYNKNFYEDSYSAEMSRSSEVPVIDRYAGKDQMIQKGILFTAFTGYRIFDSFSLGLQFNAVGFDRNGDYLNQNRDDYGNVDNYISSNKDFKLRTQDYKHTDVAIGLAYTRNNEFTIGVKGGLLKGDVDQNHLDENAYLYQYNEPNVSDEWYYHMSDYNSAQTWNHEGSTKYLGFNFSKAIKQSKVNGYYKYSSANIDAKTSSYLIDTSFSSNRYLEYNTTNYSTSQYSSFNNDIRSSTGDRDTKRHEGMINVNWALTENTKVYTGFYFSQQTSTIISVEKALYNNRNSYERTGQYANSNYYERNEDKVLTWNYENTHSSFQIPIIFDFTINEKFGIMLGINRVFHDWNISSRTSVYLYKRKNNDNGVIKEENNFIERYIEPTDTYTEDYTDVFTKFNVNVTEELQVNLLINPEFDDTFRIAQWWLSFRANL